jgi:hypothetical protein
LAHAMLDDVVAACTAVGEAVVVTPVGLGIAVAARTSGLSRQSSPDVNADAPAV